MHLINWVAFHWDDFGASQAWCQTLNFWNSFTEVDSGYDSRCDTGVVAGDACVWDTFFNFSFRVGVDWALRNAFQRDANLIFTFNDFVFQHWGTFAEGVFVFTTEGVFVLTGEKITGFIIASFIREPFW